MADTYHPRGVLVHGYRPREHPLYSVWADMKSRCNNPGETGYDNYGGRGITYCEQWRDFANFAEDMWPKPPGTSLERRDNDGNYSKDNCVWATRLQQAKNRRTFKNNKVGIAGVVVLPRGGFNARYNSDGVRYDLGNFDTAREAAEVRREFVALFESGRLSEAMLLVSRGRRTRSERRLSRDSTTGIKGVARHPDGGFVVRARTIGGERRYLGYVKTIEEAVTLLGSNS